MPSIVQSSLGYTNYGSASRVKDAYQLLDTLPVGPHELRLCEMIGPGVKLFLGDPHLVVVRALHRVPVRVANEAELADLLPLNELQYIDQALLRELGPLFRKLVILGEQDLSNELFFLVHISKLLRRVH